MMGSPAHATQLTVWARIGESAVGPAVLPMVEQRENIARRASAVGAGAESASGAARSRDPTGRALTAAMDRCARGDPAAFDELYRLAAPRVRGFLLRLCGDAALADDLTQEAFLRVHRARGSFAEGASAFPWILAIARNALRDSARRAQARPSVGGTTNATDDGPQHEAAPDARGDEVLAAREMLEIVRRTLAAMPVLHREAFVLIRFEGLSVSEAAQVLGATEGAVKVRAFRAYEALRAALSAQAEDAR